VRVVRFSVFPNFAVDGYVGHHAHCHKLLRHILSDEVDVLLMGQLHREGDFYLAGELAVVSRLAAFDLVPKN